MKPIKIKDINHKVFIFLLSAISLLKLYTIRKSEIVAEPTDPENYLTRAYEGVWFSSKISLGHLGHPPGYSLFIWLSSLSGIPLRLCHEILYFFSVILLIISLRYWKIPRTVCALIFFVIIFHPLLFKFFNDVRSEAIAVSLFNIFFALTIMVITSVKRSNKIIYSGLSGLTLGLIGVTRPETAAMYFYLIGVGLIIWLSRDQLREKVKKISYFLIIPLVIFLLVTSLFSALNYISLGVPGVSITDSKSFKGVYTQLMKIDIKTNQRYIPISQAQLNAAYEVSPTLKELKPFMPHEEIDGAHTGWSLMNAAKKSIDNPNAKKVYQVFTNINNELNYAFRNNLLPRKRISFSFLDPNFELWLPHWKDSIVKVVKTFVIPPLLKAEDIFPIDNPKASISMFNQMANRRAALVGYQYQDSKIVVLLNQINRFIYLLNISGLISFLILFVYYLKSNIKSKFLSNYGLIVSMILLIEVARLLLYSLVDATAWPIPLRYPFPGMPIFSALSVLNLFVIIDLIIKRGFPFLQGRQLQK